MAIGGLLPTPNYAGRIEVDLNKFEASNQSVHAPNFVKLPPNMKISHWLEVDTDFHFILFKVRNLDERPKTTEWRIYNYFFIVEEC